MALHGLRPGDHRGQAMSTLDVHVQKCTQCAWEITLSGADAEERGLVAWMAHVAALHVDRYRAARDAVWERWSRLMAEEALEADRQRCAETGHGGTYDFTSDGEPVCSQCGGTITVEWMKAYYEAHGHTVRITEDGKGIVIGSATHHEEKPPSEGETPDVVIARLIKTATDGFAPVLQQLSVLVGRMLEPPAEHRDHLRDKLGGKD